MAEATGENPVVPGRKDHRKMLLMTNELRRTSGILDAGKHDKSTSYTEDSLIDGKDSPRVRVLEAGVHPDGEEYVLSVESNMADYLILKKKLDEGRC